MLPRPGWNGNMPNRLAPDRVVGLTAGSKYQPRLAVLRELALLFIAGVQPKAV